MATPIETMPHVLAIVMAACLLLLRPLGMLGALSGLLNGIAMRMAFGDSGVTESLGVG